MERERRRRARRERTEKSKRLKALKGLYNIHYQRVSLCEISLGSAATRRTRPSLPPPLLPSLRPLAPSSIPLPPTPHPRPRNRVSAVFISPRVALSLFRSIRRPSSLGVQSSHVTAPSSGTRGGGGGKWRRKEKRGGSASDEDVAHAGDPGEITRVRTCGPWSGHMLIALFDIKK